MELRALATVIAGRHFRDAIEPVSNGSVCVFQARDLVQGEPFEDSNKLTRISAEFPGYDGFLKKNDVLLIARGMKAGSFRSTVFASDASNVIASSSVHVLRIISPVVLPEYVSCYLNSKEGQAALLEIVSGSYIGAIPRRELERIDIPILPMRSQETLVKLYDNMREQQRILDREKELKQNIVNATFASLVQ